MAKNVYRFISNCLMGVALMICYFAPAHAASDSFKTQAKISSEEKGYNFATVYAAQWTYYLIVQNKEIKKYGSFENWYKNPFDPHYDRDSFDYNLYKHTLAGHYYYLFYRSRNYTEQNAFIWTYLSSLVFEFTIETVTERPSYQDLYQTPVYGTVLGVGVENLSNYLHDTDTKIGHFFGYLLNPFTLIPPTNHFIGTFEMLPAGEVAMRVGWEFE